MNEKIYDAVIIGAGLTGLLTAYTLSDNGFYIAIIDKNQFTNPKNLVYDFRTTAISEGSKIFLENLRIWKKISKFAQPIEKIRVFDRNISNKIEFKNPQKKSFLGYIVENKHLKEIPIKDLKSKKNLDIITNSTLYDIDTERDVVISKTSKGKFQSKIIIAADGKNSFVRKICKNPIFTKNYKHKAFVINLRHQKDHQNIAYELFYKTGPLAILPMKKNFSGKFCSSIVWSHNSDFVDSLNKINKHL